MTIDDKSRDEKLQYDINIEAAKISALSNGKIDKYEYLIDKEMLPSNQRYCLLICSWQIIWKQIKTVEVQGEKQIKAHEEYGKYLVKSSGQKKCWAHLKQK